MLFEKQMLVELSSSYMNIHKHLLIRGNLISFKFVNTVPRYFLWKFVHTYVSVQSKQVFREIEELEMYMLNMPLLQSKKY